MKNEILQYTSSDHLFSFESSMNESMSIPEVPPAHIDTTLLNLYGNFMSCNIDSSSLYNINDRYNFAIIPPPPPPPPQFPMVVDYQSGLSSIMTAKRLDCHYDAAGSYRPPNCNHDDGSLVQSLPFPKKLSVPELHFNDNIQAIRNPRKRQLDQVTGCNKVVANDQWKTKKKILIHPEQKPSQDKTQVTLEIPREKLPAVRRSQKLSDKITALQKLVSPYGKTDTASVLEEAYISIKLLQDQIQNLFNKLSSSSSADTGPLQYPKTEETQSDLRNREMCLVPVSFTQRLRVLQEHLNQRLVSRNSVVPRNF